MTDDIAFYHNPRSRSAMVHWMLEEIGAPYRIVPMDMEKNEQKSPEFLAINPMGKIPAIVHRGVTITETPAIIAYLADAYPEAGLSPALDDPARGIWYRWLFFAAACFEPALVDTMFKRAPVENKRALGWGSYEDVLAALRQALTPGPYLLGEHFTAADLYVGAQLGFGMKFGAPGLKGETVFDAYVARMAERPAFQRTMG